MVYNLCIKQLTRQGVHVNSKKSALKRRFLYNFPPYLPSNRHVAKNSTDTKNGVVKINLLIIQKNLIPDFFFVKLKNIINPK